ELADQARQEAERANSARGEFLANMSHELRTPMNGIIGLSAMLAEANLANEEHELADAVNASARNLLIILNDVLDFSKIEAGELQIEAIDFDLVKTVQLIAKLQKPMAESKGLEFICEFDRDIPKYVVGDPARLQQVLNNLVSNALKFTHEGSVKIRVSGERDHDDIYYARIEVRDTGIGIPRDKQTKIFGKFQQGDSSTARKYGGTGLGLAITRNLVALMDGRIKLSSREGEGTIFSIHLPLQVSQKQAEADDSEPYEQIVGLDLSARILIVDDHPVNLLFMRKMMRDLGFSKFKTASSGHEALDLYDLDKPDLILLDCQMPEMDGFEVARRIREKQDSGAAPVIVAVTADAMKGAATKCREAGMDDYISKPVEKDKLVNILGEWLPGDFVPTQTAQHKTSQAEIIDWQHLDEFTEGDKETENHVLGIFIESLSEDMDRLERSLAAGDFHEWNAVVHKMYGACSHFGAGMMAQLCDKAQSLSQTDADNINAAHQLI
ncbi:MAG: ATP-binding protein, partial [Pseudomonadota bacterium]|nr:ATP-binding protein [Pseudomonadota bacterium]